MLKLFDRREVVTLFAWYGISAILQGIALALMIPFLQSLYTDRTHLSQWVSVIVVLGVSIVLIDTYAMVRSYRVGVYEVCDTLLDRIAERVLKLPLGWFDEVTKAKVVNATSKQINILSHLPSLLVPKMCNAVIVPIVMALATLAISWKITAIMLIPIIPLYLVWRWMSNAITMSNLQENHSAQELSARLIEFSSLQPILRATATSENGWDPLENAMRQDRDVVLEGLKSKARPGQIFNLILNVTFAIVLAYGMSTVLGHTMSPVEYLALITVVSRMVLPLTMVGLMATEVNNSMVALQSMMEIFATPALLEPGKAQKHNGNDIELRNVSFSYENRRPVLDNISLVAPTDKITAIVGPSGVGKSTILRLVARYWDTTTGQVLIGGKNVKEIGTKNVMNAVSMVFQDVYLFDTSIKENLAIAKPDATDAELQLAARRARLDEVIKHLPDGWNTQVGPGGLRLSGGERQRVAIARAFIKDAPILLLDEITSALDGENEAAIVEVLAELTRERTALVVAHRMSTIWGAHQIIVLESTAKGARVAQCGSPQELAHVPGKFRDYIRMNDAADLPEIIGRNKW